MKIHATIHKGTYITTFSLECGHRKNVENTELTRLTRKAREKEEEIDVKCDLCKKPENSFVNPSSSNTVDKPSELVVSSNNEAGQTTTPTST